MLSEQSIETPSDRVLHWSGFKSYCFRLVAMVFDEPAGINVTKVVILQTLRRVLSAITIDRAMQPGYISEACTYQKPG